MEKSTTLLVGIALLINLGPALPAREIEFWPYDRLKNAADVVVVGVVKTSEDSGEIVNSSLWQTDYVGVNTRFTVKGVLRGRFSQPEIVVFTLRPPDDKPGGNGPLLSVFRTDSSAKPGRGQIEYLLFLKDRKDGRFEPVSGPLDSSHAIREMRMPLPER